VEVDEFRFGPGQTYDVLVTRPMMPALLFAQTMDRTGYACATLAVAAGMSAPVPALDPLPLTMADMMGSMVMPARPAARPHRNMDPAPTRASTGHVALNDPGIGLRDNGRRVLTLADLHTLGAHWIRRSRTRDRVAPDWQHGALQLVLRWRRIRPIDTGAFPSRRAAAGDPAQRHHDDPPDASAWHVERTGEPSRSRSASPHTFAVQPAQRISFLVTADALGRWAWHCHLMFHMDSGMFREVVVA
jgi:FtsP/CotA-like multicopper oxidase with cupredoxin domain